MIKIKSVSSIYDSIIRYYSKIQKEVTDFTTTSAVGGLIWSFSSSLEEVYKLIDDVKKQSYIFSAEGKYLDSLIYGTFNLPRNTEQRASGYVVLYSSYPIQAPEALRLWCADYNPRTDELTNSDKALKFVTSGSGRDSGLVFTMVVPKGSDVLVEDGQKYIDLSGKFVQFVVVPVVSMLKGVGTNIPEGSIRVMATPVEGIEGVINTYSPITEFFSSPTDTPIQDRVTTLVSINGYDVKVVNAYNFSGSGLLGFETYDGRVLRGYYEGRVEGSTKVVSETVADIKLEYLQAFTKTLNLDSAKFALEAHQFTKMSKIGVEITYTLVDCWIGDRPERNAQSRPTNNVLNVLREELSNKNTIVVRQAETEIDKTMIYDPDNVLSDSGIMIDSARIGGGADIESDESYRIKLRKYLASLGKGTPTALEAGALTVPGINYAVTLPSHLSPRGTATILVSGASGLVNSYQINTLKTVLQNEWKAAGINLIVKTPQKTEVTVLCKVSVKPGFPEGLIEPEVRFVIKDYFSRKLPGESISYTELTREILSVGGVQNIWNLYIGKKLTNTTFLSNINTSKERNIYTLNATKSFGYKASIVRSMFRLQNPKYKIITKDEIDNKDATYQDRYKVYEVSKGLLKESQEEFLQVWNSSTHKKLQDVASVQDYENYLSSEAFTALGKSAVFEITRHLTESLDFTDNIPLPLNYEDVSVASMKPYQLGILEVPVIGTFYRNKEIIPLIGIEIVK